MRRIAIMLGLLTLGCVSKPNGTADGSAPLDQACTEMGCEDGLAVRVTPTAGWPAGAYTFTIEADGETTACTGALPLPACGTAAITCDKPGVQIGESGCALEPSAHAFGDITFTSSPASVSVAVERDGEPVGAQSWTPSYRTVQPNGPSCPPTCSNASVELALGL